MCASSCSRIKREIPNSGAKGDCDMIILICLLSTYSRERSISIFKKKIGGGCVFVSACDGRQSSGSGAVARP